jgi:hypothetical protein
MSQPPSSPMFYVHYVLRINAIRYSLLSSIHFFFWVETEWEEWVRYLVSGNINSKKKQREIFLYSRLMLFILFSITPIENNFHEFLLWHKWKFSSHVSNDFHCCRWRWEWGVKKNISVNEEHLDNVKWAYLVSENVITAQHDVSRLMRYATCDDISMSTLID